MLLAEVQYYSVCQTRWFAQNMWRNTTRFLSGTATYSNTHYGTVVHLPHFTNKLASEATPPLLLTVTSKQISFNSLLTWYHLCIPTKKKKHWKWRDVGMARQKVHKQGRIKVMAKCAKPHPSLHLFTKEQKCSHLRCEVNTTLITTLYLETVLTVE